MCLSHTDWQVIEALTKTVVLIPSTKLLPVFIIEVNVYLSSPFFEYKESEIKLYPVCTTIYFTGLAQSAVLL